MKVYTAELESVSPYSQSRYHDTPKTQGETANDHEERTWRGRLHVDDDGMVFIPPMAFKNCLSEAAKFLSLQIPGKGKATYTKHFEAGLLINETVSINIKAKDVPGEWLFVPASGKRGDGKRVKKCFPMITKWKGSVTINVIDETITKEVLHQHLEVAGNLIGIGRFRPRNNGYYGRFKVVKFK